MLNQALNKVKVLNTWVCCAFSNTCAIQPCSKQISTGHHLSFSSRILIVSFQTFSALHQIKGPPPSLNIHHGFCRSPFRAPYLRLPRVGKSWQELALLIHCQDLALGTRVAPPLDAGWHGAKFACLQKVSPPFQGAVLGGCHAPFPVCRWKSLGGRWQAWWWW